MNVRTTALLSLSLLLLPEIAFAADDCADPLRVAKLKKDGNTAFGAGKFDEALKSYDRAYGCDKDTSLLFNMAKADLRLGHHVEGLAAMRKFKRESPDLPKEILDAADATIAELATLVGTIGVTSNVEDARVSIGTRSLGKAPLSDVEVEPGTVVVHVEAPGRPAVDRSVAVSAGKHVDVVASFALTPASDESPAPAGPTEKPSKSTFHASPLVWIGASVAGAGLVVGVATGAASLAKVSKIKESCTGNRCPASTESDRSKANTLANVSNVGLGVAAAGAIVGAIGIGLSFHHEAPDGEPSSASAALKVGPAGLSLEGTF